MWITIEQIECLKAVGEAGSLNGASETLAKAKSAISYSIQRLEEQLGFPVLDRKEYRIKLTPQGEAFLLKSKPLLKEMDNLHEEVHKIATGIEMKLSLSATAIFPAQTLNKVLRDIMENFPQTEFTFHREILSGEKMLKNQTVDLAIFESVQDTINLDTKKIDDVHLKLVICAEHPFLRLPKKDQTMKEIIRFPQIIQRSTIQDDFHIGIHKDSKKWTVSDIDSKKDLILNNLGWGRLPGHFVDQEIKQGQLVHLKHLKYDHKVPIFLCKRKDKAFGPVLKYLWSSF